MSKKLTTEEFIEKARKIHGNKYDYSKVVYVNSQTKVCIICPIHGEFWQRPNDHLNGYGCNKCGIIKTNLKNSSKLNDFITKVKKIHNNKYIYDETLLKNQKTKVCIICPEHGRFWQLPYSHLQGCGCPHCNDSKLEREIAKMLNEINIKYINKKSFDWLGKKHLDFYLPDYNIAIECQGIQHFEPTDFGGIGENKTLERFEKDKKRDNTKIELCEANGIMLFHYFNIKKYYGTYKNEIHDTKELIKLLTN